MNKTVHFSIDDCLPSLRFLTENSFKISSVFDLELYGKLKKYHEVYNTVVTMYLFETKKGFHISQVFDGYKQELYSNRDWLKWGFHGLIDVEDEREEKYEDFVRAYVEVEKAIGNFADCELDKDKIRLHKYMATKEEVDFLQHMGVKSLLTAHDERLSYDLSAEDLVGVNSAGEIIKNGMTYTKTDLRIENMSDDLRELELSSNKNNLVIFTHEWAFKNEVDKIERIFEWLCQRGYRFI